MDITKLFNIKPENPSKKKSKPKKRTSFKVFDIIAVSALLFGGMFMGRMSVTAERHFDDAIAAIPEDSNPGLIHYLRYDKACKHIGIDSDLGKTLKVRITCFDRDRYETGKVELDIGDAQKKYDEQGKNTVIMLELVDAHKLHNGRGRKSDLSHHQHHH